MADQQGGGEPISKSTQQAIWEHYYGEGGERAPPPSPSPGRRLVRKLTKKQRLVEILRTAFGTGKPVALADLAHRSGLTPHHVSAHMTHLVHEGVAQRIGRGHFVLAEGAGKTPAQIEAEHGGSTAEEAAAQMFVIDGSEAGGARHLLLEVLNGVLQTCREVEVTLRYTPTEDGAGELTVLLKGNGLIVRSKE